MAKLKNNLPGQNTKKPTVIGLQHSPSGSLLKTAAPRDLAAKLLSSAGPGPIPQPLKFGALHTKAAPATSSGSSWTSLLSAASGGVSSALGGGLFSSGGFGFVGKLLSIFGGGKAAPLAPVAFQSPIPRQNSLSITVPGAASSVSLGVHTLNLTGQGSGIYQQSGPVVPDYYAQSAQVVHIVKQALLTSSSLNDVIAEI